MVFNSRGRNRRGRRGRGNWGGICRPSQRFLEGEGDRDRHGNIIIPAGSSRPQDLVVDVDRDRHGNIIQPAGSHLPNYRRNQNTQRTGRSRLSNNNYNDGSADSRTRGQRSSRTMNRHNHEQGHRSRTIADNRRSPTVDNYQVNSQIHVVNPPLPPPCRSTNRHPHEPQDYNLQVEIRNLNRSRSPTDQGERRYLICDDSGYRTEREICDIRDLRQDNRFSPIRHPTINYHAPHNYQISFNDNTPNYREIRATSADNYKRKREDQAVREMKVMLDNQRKAKHITTNTKQFDYRPNYINRRRLVWKVKKLKEKRRLQAKMRKRTKWNIGTSHPKGKLCLTKAGMVRHTRVTITGHSFVKRLSDKLENERRRNINGMEALDLTRVRITPDVWGKSGGQLRDIPAFTNHIKRVKPDCAIIELGTNDLCGHQQPEALAQITADNLYNILQECPWLKTLIWCQVIPRLEFLNEWKDEEVYNEDVIIFNREMVAETKLIDRLHHWRHPGLTRPDWTITTDGTHPDTEKGMGRYIRSISKACKWAKLNQLE